MPIVGPLVFYPWRAFDVARCAGRWLQLALRYHRILRRVKNDPTAVNYMDEALTPPLPGGEDDFVKTFADKIPKTYGAPVQPAVPAA